MKNLLGPPSLADNERDAKILETKTFAEEVELPASLPHLPPPLCPWERRSPCCWSPLHPVDRRRTSFPH